MSIDNVLSVSAALPRLVAANAGSSLVQLDHLNPVASSPVRCTVYFSDGLEMARTNVFAAEPNVTEVPEKVIYELTVFSSYFESRTLYMVSGHIKCRPYCTHTAIASGSQEAGFC